MSGIRSIGFLLRRQAVSGEALELSLVDALAKVGIENHCTITVRDSHRSGFSCTCRLVSVHEARVERHKVAGGAGRQLRGQVGERAARYVRAAHSRSDARQRHQREEHARQDQQRIGSRRFTPAQKGRSDTAGTSLRLSIGKVSGHNFTHSLSFDCGQCSFCRRA